MSNPEWIAQFRALLRQRGLSVREVVKAAPGMRLGHYAQVLRYLSGAGGLGQTKREALMQTARTMTVRPSRT